MVGVNCNIDTELIDQPGFSGPDRKTAVFEKELRQKSKVKQKPSQTLLNLGSNNKILCDAHTCISR